MPHNQLKLQGGVIETETPVINQTGIASSNRIRFKPDPQGLSLVEKLGGWAKFWATQITVGVVRALWGWQDTANNQWIAFGTDVNTVGSTGPVLGAIQCTVNGTTGLTSATGSLQILNPSVKYTFAQAAFVACTAGSNVFVITDGNSPTTNTGSYTVYITNPISVGGVVLQGQYRATGTTTIPSPAYSITATDAIGNPAPAIYTNANRLPITTVTFSAGSPNTLTLNFTGPYTFPVLDFVNVFDGNNTIAGTYKVLASTSTSVTVATTLSSYTYPGSGTAEVDNFGTTAQFSMTTGSPLVTYFLPHHGLSAGDVLYINNPTLVGGVTLQGDYTVNTVIDSATLTFFSQKAATSTGTQFQGAVPITGGSSSGTILTLNYASLYSTFSTGTSLPTTFNVMVQGANPSAWNQAWVISSFPTSTSIALSSTTPATSWVSGGSFSPVGGIAVYIYTNPEGLGALGNSAPGAFWSLDNWGNDLIAVPGQSTQIPYPTYNLPYQPIYRWDATEGVIALPIPNAPVASNGAFVAMPQRQIIAWGSTFSGIIDPLLIRWCDVNNFDVWAAQITNQAGSFRLPSGSAIRGGMQLPQQGLIWTDIEVWAMQYIGPPLVYGFNKIGQNCGLISRYARGSLGGIVYWMSPQFQFFVLSGNGVMPMPCPIWDVAFQDLDLVNVDKITCAPNSMFQEIAWYFPVKGGNGENSTYVKYNVITQSWDYGTLDRSAWMDVSVLQQPIGFSPLNKYIYQHEISPDADGAAMGETFTTGWFALAEGDVMPYVDQFWPDFKWGYYGQSQNANVTMSFASQAYPGSAQYSYGPYTVSQSTSYISPRIRNRLVNFTVSGTGTGTWWRLGGIRYRVQSDGKF